MIKHILEEIASELGSLGLSAFVIGSNVIEVDSNRFPIHFVIKGAKISVNCDFMPDIELANPNFIANMVDIVKECRSVCCENCKFYNEHKKSHASSLVWIQEVINA